MKRSVCDHHLFVHQFPLMTSEHIGHFHSHLQDSRSLKNVSSLKNKTKQNNNTNHKQQQHQTAEEKLREWGLVGLAWRRVHQK